MVDSLFFPRNLKFVATHWCCSSYKTLLVIGNFLMTIKFKYYNNFIAKLYGSLAIYKFVESLVKIFNLEITIRTQIGSDCSLVLNRLRYLPKTTSFTILLY